jgi:hypothetical protein
MSRGFRKASDVRDAEIAVLVSYGIGEPQTTAYTYSLPIYGVTGGGTSTFDASIVGLGGSSNISGTIHQPVTRGVVGSTIQTKTVTNFARFVVLDAIDLSAYRDSGEIVPVWKTTVKSTGTSGDLRRVFPALMAAGWDYIARDTGGQRHFDVPESSGRVLELRREPGQVDMQRCGHEYMRGFSDGRRGRDGVVRFEDRCTATYRKGYADAQNPA